MEESVQSVSQSSSGQPVIKVAGSLGVLQQRLGDIVQVLLVGQPVAGVHVVAVRQQTLYVGSDAAGSAAQPGTQTREAEFSSLSDLTPHRWPWLRTHFLKMSSNREAVSGRCRRTSSR